MAHVQAVRDTREFREFVAQRREQLGLSRLALAKIVGCAASYIQMLETGDRINPSNRFLLDLARGLQVHPEELFHRLGREMPAVLREQYEAEQSRATRGAEDSDDPAMEELHELVSQLNRRQRYALVRFLREVALA